MSEAAELVFTRVRRKGHDTVELTSPWFPHIHVSEVFLEDSDPWAVRRDGPYLEFWTVNGWAKYRHVGSNSEMNMKAFDLVEHVP